MGLLDVVPKFEPITMELIERGLGGRKQQWIIKQSLVEIHIWFTFAIYNEVYHTAEEDW
jgi:hypothetical protein